MAAVTHIIAPADRSQQSNHAARPHERGEARPTLPTRVQLLLERARHGVRMRGLKLSQRGVNRLPL
ncbi:MAG TPA: hypothetical protein PK098_10565 [Phycisphaerales bacterium]|nr:hypothetical protein [Phycisphaerales bacterium]